MAQNSGPTFLVGDGKVTSSLGSNEVEAGEVVMLADGRLLVAGSRSNGTALDFVLARYNADGSLDASFGTSGFVSVDFGSGDDHVTGLAVQSSGRIVVSGYADTGTNDDFALARFSADGVLDSSFGTNGLVTTAIGSGHDSALGMTLQPDDAIVVVGSNADNAFVVARYTAGGALDGTFGGGDGIVISDVSGSDDVARAVLIDAGANILVAGSATVSFKNNFAIARYDASGDLDPGFDGDGLATTAVTGSSFDYGTAVALLSGGDYLVAGTVGNAPPDFGLARYNSNGTLDTDFGGGDGIVTTPIGSGTDEVTSMLVQPDGKILVAGRAFTGSATDFAIVRYNSDGTLDTTFGGDGIVTTPIGSGADSGYSMVLQPDGRIVLVGSAISGANTALAIVRYNADGSLDTRFDDTKTTQTLDGAPGFTPGGLAVVLDADVSIYDRELDTAGAYTGATLTLRRHGGANADDMFSASGGLSALTEAGDLVLSGVTVGTVTQNSAGSLILTFNASATPDRVNIVARSIAYANEGTFPPSFVTIDWTFSDGNTGGQGTGGALAVTGSSTVVIPTGNDPPTAANDAFTWFENTRQLGIPAAFGDLFGDNGNGPDVDANVHTLTITHLDGVAMTPNVNGQIGLTFASGADIDIDVDTGAFGFFIGDYYDYLPAGQTRTETFTYTIDDGNGGTDTATVSITIRGIDSDDRFTGTAAADTIRAGIGVDTVRGGNGNDRLLGENGNDQLFGDAGNDTITGGVGRDIMTGGTGLDDFIFNAVNESGRSATTRDIIKDFVHLQDDIDLRAIDANGAGAGSAAFKFLAAKGAAFGGVQGQLRWFQENNVGTANDRTIIEGDTNGDRRADFQIELTGLKTLTAGDFFL